MNKQLWTQWDHTTKLKWHICLVSAVFIHTRTGWFLLFFICILLPAWIVIWHSKAALRFTLLNNWNSSSFCPRPQEESFLTQTLKANLIVKVVKVQILQLKCTYVWRGRGFLVHSWSDPIVCNCIWPTLLSFYISTSLQDSSDTWHWITGMTDEQVFQQDNHQQSAWSIFRCAGVCCTFASFFAVCLPCSHHFIRAIIENTCVYNLSFPLSLYCCMSVAPTVVYHIDTRIPALPWGGM